MPLIETKGAASAQGFGLTAAKAGPVYIEDVFSTWLYTGTGATQTITNGVDLAGKGGLVWVKQRSGGQDHTIFDTSRGVNNYLRSNSAGAQNLGGVYTDLLTAFGAAGFTLGADASTAGFVNASGSTYASWTFRKQPKFFDIVTGTGKGTFNHNLGVVPGCIILKAINAGDAWYVAHRSLTGGINGGYQVYLNGTNSETNNAVSFAATATTITPSDFVGTLYTWVAYVFAHDAGGFGLTGTDNVISCGSFTTDALGFATVNVGYEPQWVLIKPTSSAGNWQLYDNMRGMAIGASQRVLYPNLSNAEASTSNRINLRATGFQAENSGSTTYIYIAVRRGPMRTPTTGTGVYQPLTNQPQSGGLFAHNILTDFSFYKYVSGAQGWGVQDRLRGSPDSSFDSTSAESALIGGNSWDVMTGYKNPNPGAGSYASWAFRRAPGFFDVVCYSGTGVAGTVNHNLGVAPELMIVKARDNSVQPTGWWVYSSALGATKYLELESTASPTTSSSAWNNTAPTASVFTLGTGLAVNSTISGAGIKYVAYLFATVAGVSKVGSYTGNGTSQTINCGFTGGARFVMIKRTDASSDWFVFDSARGFGVGNDPRLSLNSTAAEVTTQGGISTDSSGFLVTSDNPPGININGATYIYLAIA